MGEIVVVFLKGSGYMPVFFLGPGCGNGGGGELGVSSVPRSTYAEQMPSKSLDQSRLVL